MASITKQPWYANYRNGDRDILDFSGSDAAMTRMWDRYFDAIDRGDNRTAASVYASLEWENYSKAAQAMVNQGVKPRDQRLSYPQYAFAHERPSTRRMARLQSILDSRNEPTRAVTAVSPNAPQAQTFSNTRRVTSQSTASKGNVAT